MACEQEMDSWSCGVASCTLISSLLGFDEPWSASKALHTRYTWAQRVMLISQQSLVRSLILSDLLTD